MTIERPVREPAVGEVSVEKLIELVANGDLAAEGDLFDRHQGLMYEIARGTGLPADEIADCVQSTWVKAMRKLPQLRSPASFPAWLSSIARNQARTQMRLHQRVTMTEHHLLDLRVDCHASRFVVDQEDRRRLRAAICSLDERDQFLIHLLFVEQRSYQDIAEELGWSMGSIGPNRARMLRRLRAAFDRVGDDRDPVG